MATIATSNADAGVHRGTFGNGTAAAALLLAAGVAQAQFEPEVTIGITHTDNVTLAPENEQDELIFSVAPGFDFTHESSRITVTANYLLQALRYNDLEEDDVYQEYDASLLAELVPENVFFEIGGSRTQAIVDPDQRIPVSNLPISGNRQDLDEYYASPSFQFALSESVAMRGSYRQTWVEYDRAGIESNEQGEGHFSIDNYLNERGLTWALRYDWERAQYDLSIPWEHQRATAELGVWVGSNTRIFGAGGKESAWDQPLDPAMEDEFWEAGFHQQLGERLVAEFAVGERSFGSSWRGDLDFRFRRGSMSFSYSERPTTADRARLLQVPVPGDGVELPDDFLSRPGSPERFIANRLEWRLDLEFRRSGLVLALFDEDRVDRARVDGTELPDESHRGATLIARYTVGPRTELTVSGSFLERGFEDGETRDLLHARVAADYRLGARTSLTLSYSRAEEDSEDALLDSGYVANTVSLFLTRGF